MSLELLSDRALMLRLSRRFFEERGVMEVDCPLLSFTAPIDAHIDLIKALYSKRNTAYLHSSPEYGMKRLLADGCGDIYQIGHVFRDGEHGRLHQPEFTLVEWYRKGFSFEEMIEETVNYITQFFSSDKVELISYKDAFIRYAGFDPFKETDRDLNLILGTEVEPRLGQEMLTVLTHYPADQAALARKTVHQEVETALRFEIYSQGIELANGYDELIDPIEQRDRLIEENRTRRELGKETYPIDEDFIQALEKGIPACCGVAVGFDRLMMLRRGANEINEVIPFSYFTKP